MLKKKIWWNFNIRIQIKRFFLFLAYIVKKRCPIVPGTWSKMVKKAFFISSRLEKTLSGMQSMKDERVLVCTLLGFFFLLYHFCLNLLLFVFSWQWHHPGVPPLLTLAMAVEAISSAASSRGWSRDISEFERKQKTLLWLLLSISLITPSMHSTRKYAVLCNWYVPRSILRLQCCALEILKIS